MELSVAKDWLTLITSGGTLVILIALLYLRTQFHSKDDAKRADGKIEALEDRVSKVESEIQHLPDRDTAHRLEMAILKIEGKLETMDERLKPIASISSRMQEWAMERGK